MAVPPTRVHEMLSLSACLQSAVLRATTASPGHPMTIMTYWVLFVGMHKEAAYMTLLVRTLKTLDRNTSPSHD